MAKSRDEIWKEWQDLVNMTRSDLQDWLASDASKEVGEYTGHGTSKGGKSGERIAEIKATKKDDLTESDWDHMAKVVGYIKRHNAQGGPDGDVEHSDWRYSLMNWGHDPLAT